MAADLRNYLLVTGGYWAFTITDGAIRMLVILYFHLLGYSPFEVAMLFLFYEFFGIVTNLVGGWLGARIGLNLIMHIGMGLQVIALSALTLPDSWLSVPYVMAAQALSGIAKDLNKMSAKASVKTMLNEQSGNKLFNWVAILTGSKNALKGGGFFVGAILLEFFGFRIALSILAVSLLSVLIITSILLPSGLGKMKVKPKFMQVFSTDSSINYLSAARLFLFASRDVWFVIGLPVYLYEVLNWALSEVGGFLSLWIIGYGLVQANAPLIIRYSFKKNCQPGANNARQWVLILAFIPFSIALSLTYHAPAEITIIIGLILFGVIFAINSALHSYLILAYSDSDKVSINVGFYYMANAVGRLLGTVLSGWIYQVHGLEACLWLSSFFIFFAYLFSLGLPEIEH